MISRRLLVLSALSIAALGPCPQAGAQTYPDRPIRLTAVEADALESDALEPSPGIGPMTGALEAFAEFFGIDPDLVEAAAERPAIPRAISAVRSVLRSSTTRISRFG